MCLSLEYKLNHMMLFFWIDAFLRHCSRSQRHRCCLAALEPGPCGGSKGSGFSIGSRCPGCPGTKEPGITRHLWIRVLIKIMIFSYLFQRCMVWRSGVKSFSLCMSMSTKTRYMIYIYIHLENHKDKSFCPYGFGHFFCPLRVFFPNTAMSGCKPSTYRLI